MPLPKPNAGEEKEKFINRCMGDSVMNSEYPDKEQRYKVCLSQWERKDMNDDSDIISYQFKPPEAGEDAPAAVKKILDEVYSSCRLAWVKEHPADRENQANKTMCAQSAWAAVEKAGWHKDKDDKWIKKQSQNYALKYEWEEEVFSTGTWNGDQYSDQDLESMVQNFTELSGVVKPPIKLGHDDTKWKDGMPAMGWVTGLRKEGSKLIAKLSDVPEIIYNAIKGKLYKRVSSEIYWNYKHAGRVFKRVFAGLALLGADIPAVNNLKDLEVFLSQTPDQRSFEKVCSYTRADFKETDNNSNNSGGSSEMDEQEKKNFEDKIKAEKDAREKAEKDLKEFKDKEADRIAVERKVKKENSYKEFVAFLDTEIKAFRMTPACAEILNKEGNHTYSDESGVMISLATFKEYQEKVPKILDTKEFGEQGGDDDNTKDIQDEVDRKVKEYMADKKDINYADALNAVLESNKDLAKRYVADFSIKGGEE